MKKVLMSVLVIAMMANCMSGCKQQRQEVKEVQQEEDTDNPIYHAKWSSDTTAINDSETLTWRDIPADEVAKPINYEKWVALLSYIIRSGWKKPSAKMVAVLSFGSTWRAIRTWDDALIGRSFFPPGEAEM